MCIEGSGFWTPGSLLGTSAWFLATWGFGEYAGHIASYNVTYGAIGGVVVLMTWLYLTGFIFLMGGEINAIVEARSVTPRQLQEEDGEHNDSARSQIIDSARDARDLANGSGKSRLVS